MLKGLRCLVKAELSSFPEPKLSAEDRALLEGLESEDTFDEATAYAVLLTEVAMADDRFDKAERAVIANALKELFPKRAPDIGDIIKEAESLIRAFRGATSVLGRIKQEYSDDERKKLLALIDKVIAADGREDEMEKYLREKFKRLLS